MIIGPIVTLLYYAFGFVLSYAFALLILGSIISLNLCVGVLFYRQHRLEKRIK